MQELNETQIQSISGGLTSSQMTGLVASMGQISGMVAGNILAKSLTAGSIAALSQGSTALIVGTALGPVGGLLGLIAGYEAGNFLFPEKTIWEKMKGVFS